MEQRLSSRLALRRRTMRVGLMTREYPPYVYGGAGVHVEYLSQELAKTVDDTENVVFVPAFVGLGAPHWDPYASGLLIGINRNTKPGHIARAALESIALQVVDVVEAMDADSKQPFKELRVDGGAASNDLMMQFQSDLLRIPVIRPAAIETTALGAAYLAGLATGFWESPKEIWSKRQDDTRFEPQMDVERARKIRERWGDAVGRAKNWTKE